MKKNNKDTPRSVSIIQECALEVKASTINCACICPGNLNVYAAGDSNNGVNIWTYGDRFPFRRCIGHTSEVVSIVFSQDTLQLIAGSQGGTVLIWDNNTGKSTIIISLLIT